MLQEVEQEIEVAHEVEAVRKVQKPVFYPTLPYCRLVSKEFPRTVKLTQPDDTFWVSPLPLLVTGVLIASASCELGPIYIISYQEAP